MRFHGFWVNKGEGTKHLILIDAIISSLAVSLCCNPVSTDVLAKHVGRN